MERSGVVKEGIENEGVRDTMEKKRKEWRLVGVRMTVGGMEVHCRAACCPSLAYLLVLNTPLFQEVSTVI